MIQRILTYAREEIRKAISDKNIMMVMLIGPVVYTVIFGLVYINCKVYKVPIAVVDRDHSVLSRTIIRDLESNEAIHVAYVLNTDAELEELFVREDVWSAVELPTDFEKSVKRGEQATVLMMTNSSNIVIGNYVSRGLQSVLATVGAGVSINTMERGGTPSYAVGGSSSPVSLQSRVLFNPGSNYANFVVPLLLVILIHQVVAIAAGMSWATEFAEAEGMGRAISWEYFAGKSLPYAMMAVFWFAIEVLGAHPWLAIPFNGSILLFALFALFAGVTVSVFGALVGLWIRDRLGVVQILFFFSMPAMLISGQSWTFDAMPQVVRWVGMTLPSTHMMIIYRAMSLQGSGLSILYPSFLWLAGLTLLMVWGVRRIASPQWRAQPVGE